MNMSRILNQQQLDPKQIDRNEPIQQNDQNVVFLWIQREILATKTLNDFSTRTTESPPLSEDSLSDSEGDEPYISPQPPRRLQQLQSPFNEADNTPATPSPSATSSPRVQEELSNTTWSNYIPPSTDTFSTLATTNSTEQTVLSNPQSYKMLKTEIMDIVQALQGLQSAPGAPQQSAEPALPSVSSLLKKRPRFSSLDGMVPRQPSALLLKPKPKKRRRRRDEIERKYACPVGGCNKSYGTEGALKTHIKLKHPEDPIYIQMQNPDFVWPKSVTVGDRRMSVDSNMEINGDSSNDAYEDEHIAA